MNSGTVQIDDTRFITLYRIENSIFFSECWVSVHSNEGETPKKIIKCERQIEASKNKTRIPQPWPSKDYNQLAIRYRRNTYNMGQAMPKVTVKKAIFAKDIGGGRSLQQSIGFLERSISAQKAKQNCFDMDKYGPRASSWRCKVHEELRIQTADFCFH